MYLEHFGLERRPFDLNPDPAFLYFSSQHSLAYHMLEYGLLLQHGITVITGEVGSGKTTLLRHLLDQHDEENLSVGLLADTDEDTAAELLQWIAMAFGLDHSGDRITIKKRLQDFLISNYSAGKSAVLIVDEAQNLGKAALEQLRLLNNINAGSDELIKIILVGQPELLEILKRPDLSQMAQRVTVEFHLDKLRAEDALAYVKHRLIVAGAKAQIFDKSAIYAVYYLARGIPRLMNTICDYALVYGFSNDLETLGVDSVIAAVTGRHIGVSTRSHHVSDDMQIACDYVERVSGVNLSSI